MQPRTLKMCPACGTSSVTRLSRWEWARIHQRVCPDFEQYQLDRADDANTERASFDEAMVSGRYDPSDAA